MLNFRKQDGRGGSHTTHRPHGNENSGTRDERSTRGDECGVLNERAQVSGASSGGVLSDQAQASEASSGGGKRAQGRIRLGARRGRRGSLELVVCRFVVRREADDAEGEEEAIGERTEEKGDVLQGALE